MKQKIINILSAIFQAIDTRLCMLHIKRPTIVVYMDGGICSQMEVYIQGQYYADYGFDVYYDTHWYDVCGKDQNGIMSRYLEVNEMWPHIELRRLTKWQRKWYLLFFKASRTNDNWLPTPSSIKRSLYFDQYWELPIKERERLFAKYYNHNRARIVDRCSFVSFENVVGIHVRRGDLAKGDNPVYGGVSDGYFTRAIEFCDKQFNPKKYLFFSDEPEWVEQNICPQFQQPYELMRGNKAWEDLWLLAHCSVIVASQGSFGRIAAKLNPDAVLIQCDNEYANRTRENTYFIK